MAGPGPDYSTTEILVPPQDSNGGYIIPDEGPIGPTLAEWIYGDQPGENHYSPYLSNSQRLANGNTLINAGSPGQVFEIDPDKNVVWEYIIPLFGDSPANQGQNVSNNGNFRAYKFGADYPGFEGKDLTPGTTIESGQNPLGCPLVVSTEDQGLEQEIALTYLPADRSLQISNPYQSRLSLFLVDVSGRQQALGQMDAGQHSIELPALMAGIYFVQAVSADGVVASKKILLY